jgi:hypothetical protein
MNINLIKACATALVLLTTASVIYAIEHEPQGPHHVIVVHNGTTDVWTSEHIHQEGGILYIQE